MGSSSVVVGTDLVQVSAVAASMERFGMRYLERLFTPDELAYCLREPRAAPERLAARFAAKEATFKVLRVHEEPVPWRTIEVVRSPEGYCDLALHAEALALARARGLTGFCVSLTHEADYASAVVIAERATGATGPVVAPSPATSTTPQCHD
ncbi:holo-ACP synthase [Corallococcus sp. M34]|uniref:holo-ACP synthase n=1 Tax=Citreicoccus inhibens TaxID=2849499 RepID=UPI001C23776D|nr:holo-ACP synthase [Citreicoccus inhibens]MBU8895174.1 holo-ACP synthase [Citreicoccus inhibens]